MISATRPRLSAATRRQAPSLALAAFRLASPWWPSLNPPEPKLSHRDYAMAFVDLGAMRRHMATNLLSKTFMADSNFSFFARDLPHYHRPHTHLFSHRQQHHQLSTSPSGITFIGDTREDFIYLAKVAEHTERYEEMAETMKKVALSDQERKLLSVAYKGATSARRESWRVVSSIEQQEEDLGNDYQVMMIETYRKMIESELTEICEDILEVLDQHLIPSAMSGESKVFYLKMKGDYHRYLAELATGDKPKDSVEKSFEAYKAASDVAVTELPPTHPTRLGLALNFSVFYYEILNSPGRARHLNKQAFDDATAELNTLSEESCKNSTWIMQLLKDNMALWDMQEADKAEDAKEEATQAPVEEAS